MGLVVSTLFSPVDCNYRLFLFLTVNDRNWERGCSGQFFNSQACGFFCAPFFFFSQACVVTVLFLLFQTYPTAPSCSSKCGTSLDRLISLTPPLTPIWSSVDAARLYLSSMPRYVTQTGGLVSNQPLDWLIFLTPPFYTDMFGGCGSFIFFTDAQA